MAKDKCTKDKILPSSACRTCLGCNRLKDILFVGKRDCSDYQYAGKRVWCADEAVDRYNKTGRIK